MADVFDILEESIQKEITNLEKQLEVLFSLQKTSSKKKSSVSRMASGLLPLIRSLLGQFSNRGGYSDAEVQAAAETSISQGLLNSSGNTALSTNGTVTKESIYASQSQEAVNRFHDALTTDPQNIFTIPRLMYDALADENVTRVEAINEAIQAVGYLKLLHDAIPVDYYATTAPKVLEDSKTPLEEVARNLRLASGALAVSGDPGELVRSASNDLEALIRYIGRESVYDSSQFSPSEYLSWSKRLVAAADALDDTLEPMSTRIDGALDFQASFTDAYNTQFVESGTLESAAAAIDAVVARITEILASASSGSLAITASREIVLQLIAELASIRAFVRRRDDVVDALTVTVSDKRTNFEASQTALSAVPVLSSTLAEELRAFARLAEKRLTDPTVSPVFGSSYTSLVSSLTAEYSKSSQLQAAINSFELDIMAGNSSFLMDAIRELRDLGLDRVYDAIVSGDFGVVFDIDASKASRVGHAAQEVALAFERALSGVSLLVGECKISKQLNQQKVSQMISELLARFNTRMQSQVDLRNFLDRRIRDIANRQLSALSRQLQELTAIRASEGC